MKTRYEYLDIIKSYTIICVIFGHCIQYGSGGEFLEKQLFFNDRIFQFIYSYHMPLFMLISGYLYYFSIEKAKSTQFITNKFKTLILPVFVWSVIPFILALKKQLQLYPNINLKWMVQTYLNITLHNYWFLWAVFWCTMLVTLVRCFCKDSNWIYLLIFALTFFIPDISYTHLYKFMYPYFLAGYFYNKNQCTQKMQTFLSRKYVFAIVTITFLGLLQLYNYNSYIYTTGFYLFHGIPWKQFVIDLYRYLIGFIGSIFILLIFWKSYTFFSLPLKKALTYIGKNTFGIYILSDLIFAYIINKITKNLLCLNYFVTIIETLIILLFCLFCIVLLKKNAAANRIFLGGRN